MWIIFVDVDKGVDNFYLGVDMCICGKGCVGMWIDVGRFVTFPPLGKILKKIVIFLPLSTYNKGQ
jgi:hypothetical protein